MGVDYSSTDAAFGFQPYGQLLRVGIYAIITAPTINVCVNDIVVHGSTIVSTPIGYLTAIEDGSVPDGDPQILGSVIAVMDSDMKHVQYIAPAAAGNGTIAGYVMVADHPDQLFIAQEDGDSNAIDLDEAGMNCDLIAATLCAPNSHTGLSTMELDSTSAANTEALQFRLLHPHQDDTPATDTQANARWIVRVNEHFHAATQAGLA